MRKEGRAIANHMQVEYQENLSATHLEYLWSSPGMSLAQYSKNA